MRRAHARVRRAARRRRKARDSIAQTLGKLAERGKLERGGVDATLRRIEVVERLEALAPCQLVVEAIVEDLGAKRELFSKLEGIVGADAVLASNTSSLSVTAMAAACKRPQRVAGYHFFNPVPVMKIVEVVAGELTEPVVTEALSALARRFGHTPIACKDTPGFVVNHAGRAYVPEALRILSEGVADFATIDRILVDAAGFRLGPFGLMDLVGLDVSHAVMKSMYQQYFEEPKYKPSFLCEPRVAAGLLGRKTGRGWYSYGKDGIAEAARGSASPKREKTRIGLGRSGAERAARQARSAHGGEARGGRPSASSLRWARTRRLAPLDLGLDPTPHRRGRSAVRLCQTQNSDADPRYDQ